MQSLQTDLARLLTLPPTVRALGALAALRFVDADDLTRIGVASAELDDLAAEGLIFRFSLQRRLTSTSVATVFALRRPGATALAKALDVEPGSIRAETLSSAKRSSRFLDHTLGRSRFALLLAKGLEMQLPATLLSWEHEPERLADSIHLGSDTSVTRQPLVADAFATVDGPSGPEGLLVEIDRSTERPGYLSAKYRAYLTWWKQDGPRRRFQVGALRILTVAPDQARNAKLIEACRAGTNGKAPGLFWFGSEDALVERGITAAVWARMDRSPVALWP